MKKRANYQQATATRTPTSTPTPTPKKLNQIYAQQTENLVKHKIMGNKSTE